MEKKENFKAKKTEPEDKKVEEEILSHVKPCASVYHIPNSGPRKGCRSKGLGVVDEGDW